MWFFLSLARFTAVKSFGREVASRSEDGSDDVMKSVDEAAVACFGRVRLRRRAGTLRMIGDLATTFFQDVFALFDISCSCVTVLSNTIICWSSTRQSRIPNVHC